MPITLEARIEHWRLRKVFKISRETMTTADVVYCEIRDGDVTGRGEAAGVSYRGETVDTILNDIESVRSAIESGMGREELQQKLGPGGARNAIDCALWDLEAKRAHKSIWQLLSCEPHPVNTVYTIGIDTPEVMTADVKAHSDYPLFKVKIGLGDPVAQLAMIRQAAPEVGIVVDANEALTLPDLEKLAPQLAELGVQMIEQPMPADADESLLNYEPPIPLCADESCQTSADLERLQGRYQMVNIKLDKTGGLTEALNLSRRAQESGFKLMVGNMLGTSLAMAPSFVIAQDCKFVDLDGPLLQAEDRDFPMQYDRGAVGVPDPRLWG